MNTIAKAALPAIGTAFEGGFFAGLFNLNGETYGLVVAPKAKGELEEASWGLPGNDAPTAISFNDGLASTRAMADAKSDLARWMLALDIAGFADWYLPSRDELEILYRNLKPTTQQNYCTFRDGENPSTVPVSYPYSATSPAQTQATAFAEGGEEAFAPSWYWASTQFSPTSAWFQDFGGGGQHDDHKGGEYRARAVRRFKVTP